MDHPTTRPQAPAITRAPSPTRVPDPGTPKAAIVGWILAIVLIAAVAVIQQTDWSPIKSPAPAPVATQAVAEPPAVLFEVMGRIYVKLNQFLLENSQGGPPPSSFAPAAVNAMEPMDDSAAGKIRVSIAQAELGEPKGAVERLAALQETLPADSPLAEDVIDLIELYRAPEDGTPAPGLDPAAAARLEDHHRWFGRLAAAYGKPLTDPVRVEAAGGGKALMVFLLAFLGAAVLAFLAGIGLLITGVVLAANRKLERRFVPPAPGGSIAIETVAVFAAGFVVLKIGSGVIGRYAASAESALMMTLALQWALALTILWPVVRGVRAREGLALFGLHRGRGVLREIGCGVVGYLSCLPLFVLGALISVVLVVVQAMVQEARGEKPTQPGNEIIDLVGSHGLWVVVLLFLLASLWAPLVEETIFRGALFRQLRTRWALLPAAVVTALAFGAMHGYAVPLLFPVIMLGLGFALLREWRGSIIAPMTAHCMHNAAALTLMVVTLRLLGM